MLPIRSRSLSSPAPRLPLSEVVLGTLATCNILAKAADDPLPEVADGISLPATLAPTSISLSASPRNWITI
jgi:hypothetical protein